MNKKELISEIASDTGMTKADSERVLNSVLETIKETLVSGDSVKLPGFGAFTVKERKERKGRNPQTGKDIIIPASKSPSFKAGKDLKEAIKS
jgi:DNA-binding protein HU-beta